MAEVVFTPDLLKVGDVPQLAGLSAPRRVLLEGPVLLDGSTVPADRLAEQFRWTRAAYRAAGKEAALQLEESLGEAEVARRVRDWLSR